MRDIILAVLVFGAALVAIKRPYIGVLAWTWISFMNPHRLTYGFAFNFPFAAVIAGATLMGFFLVREPKRLPMTPLIWTWILFAVWICVATFFALYPEFATEKWSRTMKIMLISFVTVAVMVREERLHWLVWITVLSLGFYGAKGGVFTLTSFTGGRQLVYGPEGSFIEENNALALALIMTLPLMRYLQIVSENVWVKRGLLGAMLLTVVSVVGSHSRGAFLAGIAMGLYLWMKSENRLRIGAALILVVALVATVAPSHWVERMQSISSYEQDTSALGRINAWWTAFHLSNARPLVGGGFNVLQQSETFARYAPDPNDVHDAHSIYFEVLGEQGYVGLILFLLLGFLAWRCGSWIIRHTRDHPELLWANRLAAMLQVSLVGFATGGAFLGLAYFDLYYHLVAMLVVTRVLVQQALQTKAETLVEATAAPDVELSRGYS